MSSTGASRLADSSDLRASSSGATSLDSIGTVRLPGGMVLRLSDRSWALHVLLRRANPVPVGKPESRDEVIGVDAGCVNHITASDGRMMNMAGETEANEHIKLNRSLSNARYGGIRRDIQRAASKGTYTRGYTA